MSGDFKNLKDVHRVEQLAKEAIIIAGVDLMMKIEALVNGKNNVRKG